MQKRHGSKSRSRSRTPDHGKRALDLQKEMTALEKRIYKEMRSLEHSINKRHTDKLTVVVDKLGSLIKK